MDQENFDKINQYVDTLSYEHVALQDQDLHDLLEVLNNYSPEYSDNVLYAHKFTIDMECMIYELQQTVLEDSKRNPTFSKQLLPLYKLFFVSLNLSRMEMFYDVCNALLQNVSCKATRANGAPSRQQEFDFFGDDIS